MADPNIGSSPDNDIVALNRRFFEVGYLKDNPLDLQRLSVATHRLLLGGQPITRGDLAAATGIDRARIVELFELIPDSAYDLGNSGGITAFVGLSILPANHRFTVAGRTLYTWCVFDGLFLAEVIGQEATIGTTCPATGTDISVHLSPAGLLGAGPEGTVMSLIDIDAKACCNDLRGSFCNHVNFFASEAAFSDWAGGQPDDRPDDKPGHECVTLDQAHRMAIERNRMRLPDIDLGV